MPETSFTYLFQIVVHQNNIQKSINYLNVKKLTELSIVAKIFSLNISVKEPKIMQHVDITKRSSLLVLMSPVKFILIYSNYVISLSLEVFRGHLFTPRRLRSDWQTIRLIRSCQLSYRHWTPEPEPSEAFLERRRPGWDTKRVRLGRERLLGCYCVLVSMVVTAG